MRLALLLLGVLSAAGVRAELVALADEQLSEVQGAGIGIVLEQVLMDASQATITINDITNTSGQNVPISVKEFYLGATGSNKGANLNPVTIGRLNHPFTLSLDKGEQILTLSEKWALGSKVVKVDGVNTTVHYWAPTGEQQSIQTAPSNVAVLGFTFPERLAPNDAGGQPCIAGFAAAGSNCSSRAAEKVDMGVRFDFNVIPGGRTDILNVDIGELAMDGSYLRLWGDGSRAQLVGEARVNIFAKTLEIMSCAEGGVNCTTAALQNERTYYATNFMANLALGYGKTQPLLFNVSSDGQFVLELPNPVRDPSNPTLAVDTRSGVGRTRADDFYANAPRTNLIIDNLNAGGTRPGPGQVPTGGYNFGSNTLGGLSFNYLKVTSHDL